MSKNKKEEQSGMPKALLSMINENAGGCFFLFYTNGDGDPQCHFQADNATMKSGMINKLSSTVEALREADNIDGESWKSHVLDSMGIKMMTLEDLEQMMDEDELPDDFLIDDEDDDDL